MTAPGWLAVRVDTLAAQCANGQITRIKAASDLRATIEQHPEYVRLVLLGHAEHLLAAWDRAHKRPADPLQESLFPELPATLHISPGRRKNWLDFTRHDWEVARNMLLARTSNAVTGAAEAARKERDDFMTAYDQVVPLLTSPQTTTADVADQLRSAA